MKKLFKKTEGFTLVELIVVIAILGILAGVGTVGYSGYIKKANMAADQTLLASLNTAFATACIENGVDSRSLDANTATATLTDGVLTAITPAEYKDEFDKYYEGGTFKVIENLVFSQPIGGFIDAGDSVAYEYGDTTIYISQNDINTLKESAFLTADGLGVANLLTKVNSVVGFGTGMVMDDDGTLSAFGELLNTPEYRTFLANSLGFESADSTAFNQKMAELSGGDPDVAQKILVNNAVLYAAKHSTTDKAGMLTILTSENPKSAITAGMGGDTGKGLAQASAAYGLYTAYVYALPDDYTETDSNGNTVTKQQLIDNTSNPVNILNGLNNANFQDYLVDEDGNWSEQAEKDFAGYMAAMQMINSSATNNSAAVEKLLTNGFTDADLIDLLEKATADN